MRPPRSKSMVRQRLASHLLCGHAQLSGTLWPHIPNEFHVKHPEPLAVRAALATVGWTTGASSQGSRQRSSTSSRRRSSHINSATSQRRGLGDHTSEHCQHHSESIQAPFRSGTQTRWSSDTARVNQLRGQRARRGILSQSAVSFSAKPPYRKPRQSHRARCPSSCQWSICLGSCTFNTRQTRRRMTPQGSKAPAHPRPPAESSTTSPNRPMVHKNP